MPIKTLDIPALAAEFTAPHPNLDPRQQRLALATFRLRGEGVHDGVPDGAAMTLHAVNGFDLNDVVGTFCFASGQAARARAERNEGTYVASIADGFEYGRLYRFVRSFVQRSRHDKETVHEK